MTAVMVTGGREHKPTPEELARFEEIWEEVDGHVLIHGAALGVVVTVALPKLRRGWRPQYDQ